MGIQNISQMQRKASREPLGKVNLMQTAFSFRDSLYLQLDPEISPIKPRKEKWKISSWELIQAARLRAEDLKYSIQRVKKERNGRQRPAGQWDAEPSHAWSLVFSSQWCPGGALLLSFYWH